MNPIEIIYELKKLGISQIAIACELEVATGVVGNVIHGRITAHQIACHIANLLGKSIHELWPGKYVFKSRGAHATRGKVMSDKSPTLVKNPGQITFIV
jgi:lambda repressor-like predicted transcriptional regulator